MLLSGCLVSLLDMKLIKKQKVLDLEKKGIHQKAGSHGQPGEGTQGSLGVEEKLLQLRKQEKEEKLLNYQDHIQMNTQQLLQIVRNMIHLGGLTMKPLKA